MISESLEIEILLDAISKCYGYDFSGYSSTFVLRRIRNYMKKNELSRASELIPVIMESSDAFYEFLQDFSISYTELFRDAEVFLEFRKTLIPHLKTYPTLKIWHIGCSTGEEAYSMAILLEEEGLLDKSTIYATDINHSFINYGKKGIYPTRKIAGSANNYNLSGGISSFSKYFSGNSQSQTFHRRLKEKITFAHHNIISDAPFGEMNVIFFRNVMIYLEEEFQNRALKTIHESLCNMGILVIGKKESITDGKSIKYEEMCKGKRIFLKKMG